MTQYTMTDIDELRAAEAVALREVVESIRHWYDGSFSTEEFTLHPENFLIAYRNAIEVRVTRELYELSPEPH